jgi:hypothetical protein
MSPDRWQQSSSSSLVPDRTYRSLPNHQCWLERMASQQAINSDRRYVGWQLFVAVADPFCALRSRPCLSKGCGECPASFVGRHNHRQHQLFPDCRAMLDPQSLIESRVLCQSAVHNVDNIVEVVGALHDGSRIDTLRV